MATPARRAISSMATPAQSTTHVGLEALAALGGHALDPRARADHRRHAPAGEHAGAAARGLREQRADEGDHLHVALARRPHDLFHDGRDVEIRLELAGLPRRDPLDRVAPAGEPLHRLPEAREAGRAFLPRERAVLVEPATAAQLLGEPGVLLHAGDVEVVVVARGLVEGVRPGEARPGRAGAGRARVQHRDGGPALGQAIGHVGADAPRSDHEDVGALHRGTLVGGRYLFGCGVRRR